MFHAFDSSPGHRPTGRAEWMALLARAPQDWLAARLWPVAGQTPRWLRRPETGLMMVQGRVGGGGERFNLGEVTVTRCALRLPSAAEPAATGVAYVLGRSHRQAELAAIADALLQDPAHQAALEEQVLLPLRRQLAEAAAQRHAKAQTTRVDFFTLAREAGGNEEEAE